MMERKLPEGWRVEKLEDILIEKFAGDWGTEDQDNKGIFVIRTTNFSNSGKINLDNIITRCIEDKIVDKKRLQEGDIILEKSGGSDNQPVGRVVYFDINEGVYICNNFTHVLRVNKEKAVPKYVMYLLLNVHKKGITEYFQNKTTGIRNLQMKKYLEFDIILPPLETQKKIVEVLEKAERVLEKRKEANGLLDELVKSRFIEMCANGSSDYESWQKIRIEDIAEQKKGAMRTGPFGSSLLHSEFVDEGVFVLGIDNAVENYFTWNKMRYITNEKYEQLKNYTVYPGDVIITIMGTVGRSAVIPADFPKAINTKHLACITLNKLIANPYFISYCIHEHPYVIQQLRNQCKGAIMDGLNLTIIKSIKIPLPPIEIQESFVNFMNQVDKLKFEMQKSLEELENLFNSLMQKAFKGELEFN